VEDLVLRLVKVRDRIEAAGRDPDSVTIVAVTKGFGMEAVGAAAAAGLLDVGENYIHDLAAKMPPARVLRFGVRWHYLGAVQRNKVRLVAASVHLWHGLDRVAAGEEIAKRRPGASVLVQVNLTGEAQRNGCSWDELDDLVGGLRAIDLDVVGLMGVGPAGDAEDSRPLFRRLVERATDLGLAEVSAGMSADYGVAVEEGATILRLGTVLFGPRPDPRGARR
jgi:pyridoxal phosphate enzyme (YggS family)